MGKWVTIVLPMKVWTPGLHAFRSKRLLAPKAMMPPHIELCSAEQSLRAEGEERIGLSNRLMALCQTRFTFGYGLSRLVWEEETRRLSLEPDPLSPFWELRASLLEALSIEEDPRKRHRIRLPLAQGSELSEYALREEFDSMCGDLLPLRCRATELEIYSQRDADWLLRESYSLRESERN